jgi:hypothetical protein
MRFVRFFLEPWAQSSRFDALETSRIGTEVSADSEDSAAWRGDTAHEPPSQVGTPILGNTQRLNTNRRATNPSGNNRSFIAVLRTIGFLPYRQDRAIIFWAHKITIFPVGYSVNS